MSQFASPEDFRICAELHKQHGKTYYFSTRFFEPQARRRVNALYGFVRVPDEWVDNPGSMSVDERRRKLDQFRRELLRGVEGVCPQHPVLRAFCDVLVQTGMSLDEPLLFLDAMEMDLTVERYETYGDLWRYMRGSAAAVGLMMTQILGIPQSDDNRRAAIALGNAMQMTNFLRDVGDDLGRGRIYLPLEDLATFGVTESEVESKQFSDRFASLMRFEIARTRALYSEGDAALRALPKANRKPILLARVLYSRILNQLERQGHNPFIRRASTSTAEKLLVAGLAFVRPEALLPPTSYSPESPSDQPTKELPR